MQAKILNDLSTLIINISKKGFIPSSYSGIMFRVLKFLNGLISRIALCWVENLRSKYEQVCLKCKIF